MITEEERAYYTRPVPKGLEDCYSLEEWRRHLLTKWLNEECGGRCSMDDAIALYGEATIRTAIGCGWVKEWGDDGIASWHG